MRQPVNRRPVHAGRVDMATRIHHAIWILALLAPACGQDEATIEYTVNGPEPAVAVLQLETFAVVDGQLDSSSMTVGERPILFPQMGAISWFDDQARSGAGVHICAVAQSDDATYAGVSPLIRLVADQTLYASLQLAQLADGDDVPTPCNAP